MSLVSSAGEEEIDQDLRRSESSSSLDTFGQIQLYDEEMESRPTFAPADDAAPTWDELKHFCSVADRFMFNVRFTIRFLGGADKLPEVTDYNPPATEETLGRLWKHVLLVERDMMTHEALLDQIRAETRQAEAVNRASAAPQGGQSRRVKAPTPERYLGEKGDSAFGFIAACNNYRDMEPGAFNNEMTLIRWALQLMGGKADAWRVRQMM